MRVSLEFAPGIFGDDTDFSTGGFKDGSNIRFVRGKPELIPGWEKLTTETLTGVCRTAFFWNDGLGLNTIAFGLHNGLTVWQVGEVADITPSSGFTAGQINGTGGSGIGTGDYGEGDYGEPSTADNFAMTWSFGARSFGELYANPRGQGIFKWENDTGTVAALLTNAPAQCNFMAVAFTDQVMAFGCTDPGDTFNAALIRISDIDDPTDWTIATDSTAQQIYIKGNGRIIGAQSVGRYIVVWTESECHLMSFSTEWSIEPIGVGGLAGPNAVTVIGQTVYWITPDLQFMAYSLGGAPVIVTCPVRSDFADNIAFSQLDKINASYVPEHGEVVWAYPDRRDGLENSREIRLSTLDGAFSLGQMGRTAMTAAIPSPAAVDPNGNVYWQERGNSADAQALSGFIETGGQYIDPAERVMLVRGFYPDFRNQEGPVWLTVWTKMEPQSEWYEVGTFVCAKGQERVDLMAQGRIIKFRLESNSVPAAWRLGKPQIDVVTTGQK